MADLKHLSDDDFKKEVLESEIPVLVDFWAEWCVPCKYIAPLVEQVATEYDGQLKVGKFDVDANPDTPADYGITSIPTLLLFKNGEIVDRRIGSLSLNELKKMLEEHL